MRLEIEAHIGCCNDCPKRVGKYLKRVKGVQSVDVYPEKTKVVVMGDLDPDIILREVQRVKKNARILTKEYGYESQQNISKKTIHPADAAVPVKKEASQKIVPVYAIKPAVEAISVKEEASVNAFAAYTPPKPSYGTDRAASEQEKYAVNFWYGLFGVGLSYSRSKTYENNGEWR